MAVAALPTLALGKAPPGLRHGVDRGSWTGQRQRQQVTDDRRLAVPRSTNHLHQILAALIEPRRPRASHRPRTIEERVAAQLSPAKINLAALGNMVPHLHWHVIARFDWDSRFPSPVWAAAQRPADPQREQAIAPRLPVLEREMIQRLATRSF